MGWIQMKRVEMSVMSGRALRDHGECRLFEKEIDEIRKKYNCRFEKARIKLILF